MGNVTGLKVAILNTDGFEQVEMLKPREVLDRAGAKTSTPLHSTGRRPGCLGR
jgi:putative intracellular protease/amidase